MKKKAGRASGRYPGVFTKKAKDGTVLRYIRYYVGDDEVSERVHSSTDKDAFEVRCELLRLVQKGEWKPRRERLMLAIAPEEAPLFKALIDLYRTDWIPRRKNKTWQKDMCKLLEKRFGSVPIPYMTLTRWEKWRDELIGEGKGAESVRKYIGFARGIYNRALETEAGRKLVDRNPLARIRLPGRPTGLKRALSIEQANALLLWTLAHDDVLFRWACLCLKMGLRVTEGRALLWSKVDMLGERVPLEQTKTDEPRWVAIPDDLVPLFKRWREESKGRGFVIGGVVDKPRDRWMAAFAGAGIPWGGSGFGTFSARNLRTTFSMLTLQAGANMGHLADLSGHDVETLRKFYAEAADEQRKAVVNVTPIRLPELAGV